MRGVEMGMVISGSGIDSAECRELRAKWRDRVQQYDDLDATLKFESEDAFIDFQHNGRTVTPYLTLMGRPVSVDAKFPWDVSSVEYANRLDRRLMSYRYEFTRENLSDLAAKGMFEEGFEPPEVLRHNVFELPCTVSCVAIGPAGEGDFPVVFVSLNAGSLVCDDDMSGYKIHEYFEALPEREPEDLVYESAVARLTPYKNMFKTVSKAMPAVAQEPASGVVPEDMERERPYGESDRPAESPEPAPQELPGRRAPAPKPVTDRRAAMEEMGGPEADEGDDYFRVEDDGESMDY